MGQKKVRRQRFFATHPVCCFCGGGETATTLDHWPGRSFFIDRHNPDQFVFPACHACNSASQEAEHVLRVIAVPDDGDDDDRDRWRATVRRVRRDYPGLIDSMLMDRRAKRSAMTRLGMARPDGLTFGDVPIVALDPKRWQTHIDLFGRKLLLALHYQCFGRPLPITGGLSFAFQTNTTIGSGSMLEKFAELTDQLVVPVHQNRQLGKQFSIRWSSREDPAIAIWAVHLHQRLFYLGITSEDARWSKLEGRPHFGPLVHK